MSSRYRFGPFEMDAAEHSLHAAGRPVVLTHRSFDTLLYLVRHPGRLVRREELIDAVWGDTVVEEGNLHGTISTVRKALAQESAESFIKTVRGLGYRFAVEVETVGPAATSEPPGASSPVAAAPAAEAGPAAAEPGAAASPRRGRSRILLAAGVAALVLAAVLVAVVSPPAGPELPAAPSGGAEARRLYQEGMERLQRRDATGAAASLLAATLADPAAPEAWHALAQACELLGSTRRAEEAAMKALQLSSALPEGRRLAIEATYLGLARRRPEAAERLLRAYELSGHAFEEGLALAEARSRAGQAKEGLDGLAELRARHPAARDDARLALLEVELLQRIEDFPRVLPAAERALAAARRQGLAEVETRVLMRLATSRLRVGSVAECGRALEELAAARRQATALGDRLLLAGVLLELGAARSDCAGPAAAEQSYREAVDLFREAGALGKLPSALYNLGDVRLDEGDLLGADRFMREALETCQAHASLCRERFLHQLGVNRLHRGELAEARQMLEEGIRLNRQLGNRARVAEAQAFLPDIAGWSGDLAQAIELQRQALRSRQELGIAGGNAWVHADLAVWLAEAGQAAEALEQASRAVTLAGEDGEKAREAYARASLASASLASGDLAAADRESARAIALLHPPQRPFASFYVWKTRVKVLLRIGQPDAAEVLIDDGLELARRGGLVTYELEGRLLAAQLALARGNRIEARRLAGELAAEARAKGFGLIAHRCEAILSGTEGAAPL